MLIQWYPGHMAKARRMLIENLKIIDVVVEIIDARAPLSTRNPDFDDLFVQKKRVIIMNKSDLASPVQTKRWIEYYKKNGIQAIEFVATNSSRKKNAVDLIEKAAEDEVVRLKQKGVSKTVRAMVVGIPNVGKSTFINRIAGATRAQVGDKPGVTKGKQWVKITPYLELMDTPGLLWPKLEIEKYAQHLAFIGSVKDDVMDVERLANYLLGELVLVCKDDVALRYKKIGNIENIEYIISNIESNYDLLEAVARSRGFILSGNEPDTERAARIVLDEFRAGKITKITLDRIEDIGKYDNVEDNNNEK